MAFLGTLVSVSSSLLLTPFLLFLLVILFLASIGKSIGVRRLYVRTLLTLFEYGRQHIEIALQRSEEDSGFNSEDEGDGSTSSEPSAAQQARTNGHTRSASFGGETRNGNGSIKNGLCAATSLISREALVLAPDPHHNRFQHRRNASNGGNAAPSNQDSKYGSPEKDEGQEDLANAALNKDHRRLSFETLKREFELADCLTYVRAGVEAIIEDEVTQCFQAEELKSWNLLTRTNRHYEFVSWRLTVIWMLGFLVRYFFLLPLRILICFIGMSNMVISSLFIALVPFEWLKRWLNKRAMLVSFRIFARALSAVLTFHNEEFAPRSAGICVANHTTPVDIVMLATENDFSLVYWLTFCTAIVGYVPSGKFKRWLNAKVSIMCFGVLSSALSAVITYHNPENKPRTGICVANHTSPIDVLVLACDNCYALIGQRHGGFLGLLQRALARASSHIWFERSEAKDREFVTNRLRQHVSDPNNPPILIFPEGTCINNTSVMQFKKGSFEVGSVIYPVAIKYDPKFGDAFWNSSEYSMMQYLSMMMSSWAIVCDVWYLPPMTQEDGESAIDFANRVKGVIAHQGGLVDLMWDGQLKRVKAKKEWKERQQEEFSKRLKLE